MSPHAPARRPAAVAARAWCRVDLAGGTLDIWPLGLLHPGARTVNVAVDLAVRVELSRRSAGYRLIAGGGEVAADSAAGLAAEADAALIGQVALHLGLPPVEIRLASASPRGAGLGASSALAVAALAAGERLLGREPSGAARLGAVARDLEAVLMGLPTGSQDHFPAQLGGALEISHRAGGERVRRLEVDLDGLADSLIVAYTGQSHISADTNWRVIRRRFERHPETVACFDGIAGVSTRLAADLEAGLLERVGTAMAEEWAYRRRLAPEVSTPAIEELLRRAGEAGAWGGKACGAGGGGCVAVLAPPERRAAVVEAIAAAGGEPLAARPEASGIEVEVLG